MISDGVVIRSAQVSQHSLWYQRWRKTTVKEKKQDKARPRKRKRKQCSQKV